MANLRILKLTTGEELVGTLKTESDKEIESRRIGDHVMRELKALDQIAYVRFASVYRSFSDVTEFIGEIEKLSDE